MAARPSPLRICVVGQASDVHVRTRTRCFAERGHAVRLVSDSLVPLPGVEVVVPRPRLAVPKLRVLGELRAHRLRIEEWRADVVHVHYAHRLPAWMVGVIEPHPLVVTVMGGDVLFRERGDASPARARLTTHLLESADLITTKTESLAEAVGSLGPFRGKCFPLAWGVRKDDFAHDGRRPWPGLDPADRIVLSLRCLTPLYGVHLAVEAWPAVLRSEPRARLLILEACPDPDYRLALRRRAEALGVSSRVTFLPEAPPEDVPDLLARAEMSLSLAESDGLPQTLLEALAAGVPVVLSRLPCYDEVVRHQESAYLVDRDAESVAAGIVRLLGDAPLRAKIAGGGRRVLARYPDFEDEVARLEREYCRLASAPRRRPGPGRRMRGLGLFLRLGVS